MKRFLSLIVLYITITNTLLAQDTTCVTECEDSYTYQTLSISNRTSENFPLENVSGVESSSDSNRAPDSGIGETEGYLTVSLTGAANYDIPIALPPGINGIEPEIGLSYNSQLGNGIAGYGWNIIGVSAITRLPSSLYHNDEINAVNFSDSDQFALDGQRLVLKSGTHGVSGAVYETENYSNLKIVAHGSPSSFGGPSSFIVSYPDGSKAYYGYNSNSSSATSYGITYWQNPQGIRISYEYVKEDNSQSIKKIKYGSRFSEAAINEIEFDYSESRARWEQSYIGGVSLLRKKLLKRIKIYGNGTKYRSYLLEYNRTRLFYKRLEKVKEFSGDDLQRHSPIYFDYPTSSSSVNISEVTTVGLNDIEQRNAEVVTFDITGNGNMDFLVYPKPEKDKFWLFKDIQGSSTNSPVQYDTGGEFETIFPSTAINHLNKLLPGQGFGVVQGDGQTLMDFKIFSNGTTSPISQLYKKTWQNPTYSHQTNPNNNIVKRIPHEYVSGDFNGDGITDVLAVGKPYSYDICEQDIDGYDCFTENNSYKQIHFINLDPRLTSNFINLAGTLPTLLEDTARLSTGDFNGDGRTDLFFHKYGNIYIYSLDVNNNLELLWQTSNSGIYNEGPLLFGDYNGDGKTDMMNPVSDNSNIYNVFMSTGESFFKEAVAKPFTFNHTVYDGNTGTQYGETLVPLDITGDGVTDILEYTWITQNGSSNGSQKLTGYNNYGLNSSTSEIPTRFEFSLPVRRTKNGNVSHFPVPIFLSSSQQNKKLEFATISDKWVTNFSYSLDHRKDVRLKNTINNGVKYDIAYSPLDPTRNHSGYNRPIYTATPYHEEFPNVDLVTAPSIMVVSQVTRSIVYGAGSADEIPPLVQIFGYQGAVHNLNGRGFIGFRGMAQSNWHSDHATRKFSVSKYDPDLRGAMTDQYYQTFDYFWNVPSENYIIKSSYEYESSLDVNKVFKLNLTGSLSQNKLTGAFESKMYQYDEYNSPTRVVTNYFGGRNVQEFTYENSSSPYYIGRPTVAKNTSSIGSESFSSEQQLSYTGHLLFQTKSKGEGTPFDIQNFEYDAFGNIIKSTAIPSGESPREISYTFDPSGRFMTSSTDLEGLTTTYDYNFSTGLINKIISPYNQETTFGYDLWNREIWTQDYLGNRVNTSYTETNNEYSVDVVGDDGSHSISEFDVLGRLVKEGAKDVLGQWVNKSYEYDALGRPYRVSEPYLDSGNPTQWTETQYDLYDRTKTQTLHTGRQINISYDGLSVTVDDGAKVVTSTQNGLGNILRVTDPGGTINYHYYGNGSVKEVITNGVRVKTEQDGWGRKTKLIDPSAGTYEYEYNGYGETTKITNPNGYTEYQYSPEGRILQKDIVGQHTDLATTYTYDPNLKFLTTQNVTDINGNNSTYNYEYDSDFRINSIEEINPYAQFKKEYSYDSFGRFETENQFAKLLLNNKTSAKKIKYNYENGQLKSLNDFNSGANIWEVLSVNARGQLTRSSIGNGIESRNVYDNYGYLENNEILTINARLLKVDTEFDIQLGNLKSRSNSMFSWEETFEYDNLDRLITFNDNNGVNQMVYDPSGRIIENPTVGEYLYATANPYQVENINLNAQGDLYYQRHQVQNVSYNAFKKPFNIEEVGKEKIGFQYNTFMGRSHMFYGDNQEENAQRNNRKHYSFDGSMEISYDSNAAKTTFVSYIGGDAYSAPAIWRSEQSQFDDIEDFYYLHRDYLGSILLITDTDGEAEEKRHFDAWGNIVQLTDGNDNPLDQLTFLDRGYTGHEHLQGVHLIHMNGRLYDPNLKRFLAPDNFIQDGGNTQNFNRYGYVLNNPLRYTDPSGEMTNETGGAGSALYIAAAAFASLVHSAKIKPFKAIGNFGESIGNFFKGIFGGNKKSLPQAVTNPTNLTSDPLAGTSANTPTELFGGSGTKSEGLGIKGWLGKHLTSALLFQMGGNQGFIAGAESSWAFIKSLGTAQGWKNVGNGLVQMGDFFNIHSMTGHIKRVQAAQSVFNYVSNIPNMNAYEIGHDIGFAFEKVVESVLLSKGVGAVGNVAKSGLQSFRGVSVATNNVAGASSRILNTTAKQLQRKFKHAGDFGVTGNFSKANATRFNSAINQHINSSGVKLIQGTYRGNPVIHHLNPNTGLNVIANPNGTFLSGWRLNSAQLQNVVQHGGL